MKKSVFYALACALCFTGCNNENPVESPVTNTNGELSPIQFGVTLKKDVIDFPTTRSMPPLDISEPTVSKSETNPDDSAVTDIQDLCARIEYIVYKKEEDIPVFFKHKQYTPSDMDFGIVYDTLPHGDYQFYFLAHSSENTTLSGSSLSFDEISDTFYSSLAQTIAPAEIISEDITLNRIVSKIELKATDSIPTELKRFDMTVTGRSKELDLTDGKGTANTTPHLFSYTFTTEDIGKKDNIHSFYTFFPPEQGKLEIHTEAFATNEELIRERVVKNIQPQMNKIIRYSGRLYSKSESDDTFMLSIFNNGAWSDTTTVNLPEYD